MNISDEQQDHDAELIVEPRPLTDDGVAEDRPEMMDDSSAATSSVPATAQGAAEQITGLFAQLEINTTADGGVTIKAPPQAATSLAALFDGMARMLAASASRSGP